MGLQFGDLEFGGQTVDVSDNGDPNRRSPSKMMLFSWENQPTIRVKSSNSSTNGTSYWGGLRIVL